ncbi:hypothetical protein Taro_002590 [Colocasia esculenta]|uniref:Uncharacterized protein n=1 Tax=Colocasia esculenta TaxID=4460 RepID=A0A843TEK0_COLES|nr:hypothetical protein [Colocasia esculenta]
MVPVASNVSPFSVYVTLGVSGSVGDDHENWVLGVGRGSGSRSHYTREGRVEEFLVAGEAGDPHTKPFFFSVVSAGTCTDSHLEVDQRNPHNTLT